ncbi:hypothetical protein ACTZGB_17060 [Yersinia bercovieri]|uniref:hypothetical protein n=1 Tax=Yersinia bercovieri TaxID=634 RepID=UPI003FD81FC1
MLSKELTIDGWTKIARGEWKPKPYDLRMAGFDALKLLTRAESAEAEPLSLREQLAELKALPPVGRVISCNGNKTLGWINDAPEGTLLFTATKLVDVDTIQDELIEQVGVMCDRAVNIHEKNIYGEAYCVLKYGILPYLRKQGK